MARAAEGLPTKPKRKVKPKKRSHQTGPRPGNHKGGGPKGNQHWRLALHTGPEKKYTPEELLAKAQEYFDWVDAHPWIKAGGGKQKLDRPYTLGAFCQFAGIHDDTFTNYSEGIGYQDYFGVCKAIRSVIRNQKFEGATIGVFNAAIIARDLGLVDKQERDIGNKGGVPFQTENKTLTAEITPDMDEKTASQIYRSLLNPPKEQA